MNLLEDEAIVPFFIIPMKCAVACQQAPQHPYCSTKRSGARPDKILCTRPSVTVSSWQPYFCTRGRVLCKLLTVLLLCFQQQWPRGLNTREEIFWKLVWTLPAEPLAWGVIVTNTQGHCLSETQKKSCLISSNSLHQVFYLIWFVGLWDCESNILLPTFIFAHVLMLFVTEQLMKMK